VISGWLKIDEQQRVWTVGNYFHFAGGFEAIKAEDISPHPGQTDPLHIVRAKKASKIRHKKKAANNLLITFTN